MELLLLLGSRSRRRYGGCHQRRKLDSYTGGGSRGHGEGHLSRLWLKLMLLLLQSGGGRSSRRGLWLQRSGLPPSLWGRRRRRRGWWRRWRRRRRGQEPACRPSIRRLHQVQVELEVHVGPARAAPWCPRVRSPSALRQDLAQGRGEHLNAGRVVAGMRRRGAAAGVLQQVLLVRLRGGRLAQRLHRDNWKLRAKEKRRISAFSR